MPRRASLICVCAIIGAAGVRQARIGYAHLRAYPETADALAAATQIDPADAALRRRLAVALLPHHPEQAQRALHAAAALNPYDSDALLGLGLLAESRAQLPEAERYLILATRQSRRLKPHAELAAFYLRRRDRGNFWDAARAAAAVEAADATRVFEMAHQAEPDPAVVPRLLRPPTVATRVAYLAFALARNYPTAAAQIAPALPATPPTRDLLLLACDRLIDASLAREAVSLWNRLAAAHLIDAAPLRPESGLSLTNGTFRRAEPRGFNWRPAAAESVEAAYVPAGLRIALSDRRPERLILLEQPLPVLPARRYRFTCRLADADPAPFTGLHWRVLSNDSDSEGPRGGALEFETPRGTTIVRLLLTCERPAGTIRREASLTLAHADLRLLE